MAVEDDERQHHEQRVPVELELRIGLPSEAIAEVECPDEYQDDDEAAQSGRQSIEEGHEAQVGGRR